jgi:hypothetical protein
MTVSLRRSLDSYRDNRSNLYFLLRLVLFCLIRKEPKESRPIDFRPPLTVSGNSTLRASGACLIFTDTVIHPEPASRSVPAGPQLRKQHLSRLLFFLRWVERRTMENLLIEFPEQSAFYGYFREAKNSAASEQIPGRSPG